MNTEEYAKLITFGLTYDKDEILSNAKGIRVITKGDYPYDIFNFYFVNDMLSQILQTLYEGYIPYIDLSDRKEGDSNWNMWFEQPFRTDLATTQLPITKAEERVPVLWGPNYLAPFEEYESQLACRLYNDWLVFNDDVVDYIMEEKFKVLGPWKDKGVIGCLCRGTDFTSTKPKGHPVQPTIEEVLPEVKGLLKTGEYSRIYLATEERRIYERFEEEFPGMVLTNAREYLDDRYYEALEGSNGQNILLKDVQFEEPDERFMQGLSYLSSIVLLSSCDVLVAGNCGGSDAALFFNGMKYRYTQLFNLGLYE